MRGVLANTAHHRRFPVGSDLSVDAVRFQSLDELDYFSSDEDKKGHAPLAFVAVSRNYELDQSALRRVIPSVDEIPYVGMIGSKRKVTRVFETLREEGVDEELLRKIHAPIGLDIGAESPGEIAISVLSQILAVTRGRSGEHLTLLKTDTK